MSIKPLSYHGFSLDFLVAGSNREKEGKRPGDNMACLLTAVIGELKGDNLRVVRQQKSYYWSAKDCFVAGVSFRASFELIEGREGTVRSDGERKEEISSTEMPCAAETERKQKLT